jgi:two-component system cell cycle response regulator DivK
VKQRVLVIEDNEQNLYLMEFLLRKHDLDVVCARDGREGIANARAVTPDLILLDIQLPEMSGYDVARSLRQDPGLASVPIVAVTSYAMPGDREQVLAAGCTGYIEKPINPDTFLAQLEGFFSRTEGGIAQAGREAMRRTP